MPSLLATEDAKSDAYLEEAAIKPLLMCSDALGLYRKLPASCMDCAMTSPRSARLA